MRGPFPTMLAAALLLAAALPGAVTAKDLGVRGATWPVVEPDLLAQIEARLLEMERSGELARLEHEARASARRKLEEPDPVSGIAPAREERSRLWNPAITVARDIRTPDGTLIAAAGTRANPLERMTLARDLLFVDGRREAEIAWALFRGTVGEAAAVEFTAFLKVWRELPHPRAVLDDPANADIPENASTLMALCGSLYRMACDINMDAIVTYATRLRREVGESLVGACVRREACSAMRGHRANASTHPVGRTAPPFGSRPGARPRRHGPQPYSLIRFSARSWRIERLGATQAVTLVRIAG